MSGKLAIIGNGFDISHGLKTGYLDFAKTLPKKIKEDWEGILTEGDINPETWYSFEDAIDKITAKWQEKYFDTVVGKDNDFTEEVLLKKIDQINKIFVEINNLLMDYLLNEDSKEVELKDSIKKTLDYNTNVINFNYTTTIEKYTTNNIYYIHGSLSELEIVLGYKQRIEPTGIMLEATEFDKKKLRERLNFKRYLIDRGVSGEELEMEMENFSFHIKRMFTNRGGYVFEYPSSLDRILLKYIDKWYTVFKLAIVKFYSEC
uniref:AbiH family protein n=1 Tax=Candidatus Enterococcus willemsii TaxID=1857215 RepID=UPI00403F9CB9